MTAEEAISRFKDEINGEGFYSDNAHREMAVEALAKKIPKQIIMNNYLICYCPECDGIVKLEDLFCRWCGQKFNDGHRYIKDYNPEVQSDDSKSKE